MRADGGAIVHAHPFREKVDHVHLFPGKIDAVEVINANRDDECNQHARNFADSFKLPYAAGSDIHSTTRQRRLGGVIAPRRLADPHDYIAAVLAREITVFQEPIVRT